MEAMSTFVDATGLIEDDFSTTPLLRDCLISDALLPFAQECCIDAIDSSVVSNSCDFVPCASFAGSTTAPLTCASLSEEWEIKREVELLNETTANSHSNQRILLDDGCLSVVNGTKVPTNTNHGDRQILLRLATQKKSSGSTSTGVKDELQTRLPPSPPESVDAGSSSDVFWHLYADYRQKEASSMEMHAATRRCRSKVNALAQAMDLISDQKPGDWGTPCLTTEEKRTLQQEGYVIPTRLPLSAHEQHALKHVRRKILNKLSAHESRRKQREYVESLEARMQAVNWENSSLKQKVQSLEQTNRTLLEQLRQLRRTVQMSTVTRTGVALMMFGLLFALFVPYLPAVQLPFLSESINGFNTNVVTDDSYNTAKPMARILLAASPQSLGDFDIHLCDTLQLYYAGENYTREELQRACPQYDIVEIDADEFDLDSNHTLPTTTTVELGNQSLSIKCESSASRCAVTYSST